MSLNDTPKSLSLLISILFIYLIGCASPPPDIEPGTTFPEEVKSPLPLIEETSQVKPPSEPSFQTDETILLPGGPMIIRTYQRITKKISTAEYDEALNELDQFIHRYTTPQLYVVEAHLLRFILLSGSRAGYLQLADAYHLGWEKIFRTPDKELATEERIARLTNLSKTSLEYFQKHKEMVVRLIKAYEEFKGFYPALKRERLRLIAYPFKVSRAMENTRLAEIKKWGSWLETAERLKAEEIEINKGVLDFWTSLMKVGNTSDANSLLARGPYLLDEQAFFIWLGKSLVYQINSARPEAFMDEPELVGILQAKSAECLNWGK